MASLVSPLRQQGPRARNPCWRSGLDDFRGTDVLELGEMYRRQARQKYPPLLRGRSGGVILVLRFTNPTRQRRASPSAFFDVSTSPGASLRSVPRSRVGLLESSLHTNSVEVDRLAAYPTNTGT